MPPAGQEVKDNWFKVALWRSSKKHADPSHRYKQHITHREYLDCSYYKYVNCKDLRFCRCWQCRDYYYYWEVVN